MKGEMADVTEIEKPVIDIWPYIGQLNQEGLVLDYVYYNRLVEIVYRNGSGTFDHILLPTDTQNIFIVIVVNLLQATIKGYYKLDLNKKYGIS